MPDNLNYVTRSELPEWKDLEEHLGQIKETHIKDLFDKDSERFHHFHVQHENIMLDYSKQLITNETMDKFIALAKACDLEGWRKKMFEGETINTTENRAVLHTALRTQDSTPIIIDGEDIIPQVKDALKRIKSFCATLDKEKKFTHIVNIGIGGSDGGPTTVYYGLEHFVNPDYDLHFVSNIDGTHLAETLRAIDPKKTLFIITSKTFTTQETMTNADSAKAWLQEKLGKDAVSEHFVAATKNIEVAKEFGIKEENIFPLWDWVGGRFSLWGSIGLSCCIALGYDQFEELLKGAYSMDQHFLNAPLEKNMPVLMGLLGIWHRNFLNYPAIAIAPYDEYLCRFPAYMQQIDMESNGKMISRQNQPVEYETGPVVLGKSGTNAQHAFFQLVHQGTTVIPCDFILVAKTQNPIGEHHKMLLANAVAQTKALMDGQINKDPHRAFEGNRPSNTIILDELTPYTLGMLLALYEHKIFVQGIIWDINSFDQCGVELGKILANQIIDDFDQNPDDISTDSSTREILKYLKSI